MYNISPTVVNNWSDALTNENKYNQLNTPCELCNGTLIANITGKIGKYSYSSSIITSAIAAYPKVNSKRIVSLLQGRSLLASLRLRSQSRPGSEQA